jgi:hypothetical protein
MLDHLLAACNAMIIGFGQRLMVGAANAFFGRMCVRDDGTWSAINKAYEQNGSYLHYLNS